MVGGDFEVGFNVSCGVGFVVVVDGSVGFLLDSDTTFSFEFIIVESKDDIFSSDSMGNSSFNLLINFSTNVSTNSSVLSGGIS